jgi:hypothetical protein
MHNYWLLPKLLLTKPTPPKQIENLIGTHFNKKNLLHVVWSKSITKNDQKKI